MALSTPQLQALKTWLDANAANLDDQSAAVLLNTDASPIYWVKRTRVHKTEITNQTSQDGTVFVWAGNGYITRAVGERDCWRELFNGDGYVDMSRPNVEQAFVDIFSGTGNAASNRAHLLVVQRRHASNGERVLATGTGSSAAPALLGYEGPFSPQNVVDARNS